jgi:uncharacterized protein YeeX (DUF496 family)
MKLLQKLSDDTEKKISNAIFSNMKRFLNNRIGTYLKKDVEIPYIREQYSKFKKGEMVIEIIGDEMYKWGMYIEPVGDGIVKICTKAEITAEDYIIKDIAITSLTKFSESETIEQVYKGLDNKLSESELLETYRIN